MPKLTIPTELRDALNEGIQIAEVFEQLIKGKQREYANHISEVKWKATKKMY